MEASLQTRAPGQWSHFREDVLWLLGKRKSRLLYIWLSRSFWGILSYRLERALFLTIGPAYAALRIPFIPLFNLVQAYSNVEIPYKADIQGGLSILHPALGVVVSQHAVIGSHMTLTGGNVIGMRAQGTVVIGDNCTLGANAVILGPVRLGNRISVGAMACVVKDCLRDGSTLVGVPAKEA